MATQSAARQFSFRLPVALVDRAEDCTATLPAKGLEVTRADVVRLLLKDALDATHCQIELLLGGGTSKKCRSDQE